VSDAPLTPALSRREREKRKPSPGGRGLGEGLRATLLSLGLLAALLVAWQLAVQGGASTAAVDPEYAKLMGQSTTVSAIPGPLAVGARLAELLAHPFYDKGPNDKGIGTQLAFSLARVLAGFGLAMLVALPLGFVIGLSRTIGRALDPFIQVLKPISPLAWMPLASTPSATAAGRRSSSFSSARSGRCCSTPRSASPACGANG